MTIDVRHEVEHQRFVAIVDGVEAVLDYEEGAGILRITHTVVPPAIGGRGIAGELVRAALDHARADSLKVIPDCSYAAAFIRRHTQYADLLAG